MASTSSTSSPKFVAGNRMREIVIIVMGSAKVGKTALTSQFLDGIFIEKYEPTVEDIYKKTASANGHYYMLNILDTAGMERFTAMRDLYFKKGKGFILVYSVEDRNSLHEVIEIREQLLKIRDEDWVPMVIVANKADLQSTRVISTEEGACFAEQFNCPFIELCAKSKEDVHKVFENIIKYIEEEFPPKTPKKKTNCTIL